MQQDPPTKEDRYPATVWSRYRNTGMPIVGVLAAAAIAAGLLLGFDWLTAFGQLAGALALVVIVPVLVLEYRADMKYDRTHPAAAGEFLADEQVQA